MPFWSYDFGSVTLAELGAFTVENFTKAIGEARNSAVNLIESGAVGDDATEKYRVVVRNDGGIPSGIFLEVRAEPVPAPIEPTPPPAPVIRELRDPELAPEDG